MYRARITPRDYSIRSISTVLFFLSFARENTRRRTLKYLKFLHLSQLVPVSPGKQKHAYLPPGNDSHVDPKLQGSEEQAMWS